MILSISLHYCWFFRREGSRLSSVGQLISAHDTHMNNQHPLLTLHDSLVPMTSIPIVDHHLLVLLQRPQQQQRHHLVLQQQ